jgi:hypothetical protein
MVSLFLSVQKGEMIDEDHPLLSRVFFTEKSGSITTGGKKVKDFAEKYQEKAYKHNHERHGSSLS